MDGAFLALILVIVMICALGSIAGQVGMTVSANGTGVVVGNANQLAAATAVVNRSIADADAVRIAAESRADTDRLAAEAKAKADAQAAAAKAALEAQFAKESIISTATLRPIVVTREILENKRIENNILMTATVGFAAAESQSHYILTGNKVVDFLIVTVGFVYLICIFLGVQAVYQRKNKHNPWRDNGF